MLSTALKPFRFSSAWLWAWREGPRSSNLSPLRIAGKLDPYSWKVSCILMRSITLCYTFNHSPFSLTCPFSICYYSSVFIDASVVSLLQNVPIQFPWSQLCSKCMILKRVGGETRVTFMTLCISPLYQCLCSDEKGQAGLAIWLSKWAHLPALPIYWSVDWFLRFIEIHSLPKSLGTSATVTSSTIKRWMFLVPKASCHSSVLF